VDKGAGVYLSQSARRPNRVGTPAGTAESLFWVLGWCTCSPDVVQGGAGVGRRNRLEAGGLNSSHTGRVGSIADAGCSAGPERSGN
jgi:hypothetical protein